MIPLNYDIAYSDGFFAAIQRLNDLLCGSNKFQGFTKKQIEAFLTGTFDTLIESESNRELLRSCDNLQITCDISEDGKKKELKNFRLKIRS